MKDRATQFLKKYKNGALVTQKEEIDPPCNLHRDSTTTPTSCSCSGATRPGGMQWYLGQSSTSASGAINLPLLSDLVLVLATTICTTWPGRQAGGGQEPMDSSGRHCRGETLSDIQQTGRDGDCGGCKVLKKSDYVSQILSNLTNAKFSMLPFTHRNPAPP